MNDFIWYFICIPFTLCCATGFCCFGIGKAQQRKESNKMIYREALRIFYVWRNEIGGVALKGVGQHYEAWIQKKIQDEALSRSPSPEVKSLHKKYEGRKR